MQGWNRRFAMLLSIQNLEVRYGSNKALSITAPIELEEGTGWG